MVSMASARSIIEDPETGETRTWIFKTPQENLHSGEWQALYLEALETRAREIREELERIESNIERLARAVEDRGGHYQLVMHFDELQDVAVADDGTIFLVANKFRTKTSGLPRYDQAQKGEGGEGGDGLVPFHEPRKCQP